MKEEFVRFARMEAAGGIVLLLSTVVALIWANSPWQHCYHHFLETKVSIGVGSFVIMGDCHHRVNDGLMALYGAATDVQSVQLNDTLRRYRLISTPLHQGMIEPSATYKPSR